jgi:hypothetical protein
VNAPATPKILRSTRLDPPRGLTAPRPAPPREPFERLWRRVQALMVAEAAVGRRGQPRA